MPGVRYEYKHLTQKPEFCSATVIAMIALRKGIWLDPEEIGDELHLKITPDVASAFEKHFGITPKVEDAGYDVDKINPAALTKIMHEHGLHLKAEFHPISATGDVGEFLVENMRADHDIAMLFLLKPMGFEEKSYAHYVLVERYEPATDTIWVCDSEALHESHWKAPREKFEDAMSAKYDGKERGFLVFEEC